MAVVKQYAIRRMSQVKAVLVSNATKDVAWLYCLVHVQVGRILLVYSQIQLPHFQKAAVMNSVGCD